MRTIQDIFYGVWKVWQLSSLLHAIVAKRIDRLLKEYIHFKTNIGITISNIAFASYLYIHSICELPFKFYEFYEPLRILILYKFSQNRIKYIPNKCNIPQTLNPLHLVFTLPKQITEIRLKPAILYSHINNRFLFSLICRNLSTGFIKQISCLPVSKDA